MRGALNSRLSTALIAAAVLMLAALGWTVSNDTVLVERAEAQPTGETQEADVTSVVDGDTIDVSPPAEGRDRVRLSGVDTPEVFGGTEPCGPEASAFTKEQLEGQRVTLEYDEDRIDPFDRALAYVWRGDELFNETLVRQGYASVATFEPNVKYEDRFVAAEEQAKAEKLGIWANNGCSYAQAEPTTPGPPALEPATQDTTTPSPQTTTEATPDPQSNGRAGRGGGGGGDSLLRAGRPQDGSVPLMPGGRCPVEFPLKREGACYA